jgi:hypothetical protein
MKNTSSIEPLWVTNRGRILRYLNLGEGLNTNEATHVLSLMQAWLQSKGYFATDKLLRESEPYVLFHKFKFDTNFKRKVTK